MNGLNSLTQMANRSDGLDKLAELAIKQETGLDTLSKMAGLNPLGQLQKVAYGARTLRSFAGSLLDLVEGSSGSRRAIIKGWDSLDDAARSSAIKKYMSENITSDNYQASLNLAKRHGLLDDAVGRGHFANKYNQLFGGNHKASDLFESTGGMGGRARFMDASSPDASVYEFAGGRQNGSFVKMPSVKDTPRVGDAAGYGDIEALTELANARNLHLTPKATGIAGFMQDKPWAPYAAGGVGMMALNNMSGRRGY